MQVKAFEGVIENGQIRLKTNINLPDKTKVYVIIPDFEAQKVVHVYSPRLAHPEQAVDFKKEVIEELPNAGV
jgi:hypothetical protein